MVAKPEWGKRHVCIQCGARFYDMQKHPLICPKCGVEFNPDALLKCRAKGVLREQPKEVPPFDKEIDIDNIETALGLDDLQPATEDVLEDAEDLSGNVVEDVAGVYNNDFEKEE
ncbi:MAG: TIGR02300 family protein [Holosporales bacterium]|jgi:uncharacterized protein (TIGR02300 family)|nr:TIGR02300 family protein [Holosporales bacterium]